MKYSGDLYYLDETKFPEQLSKEKTQEYFDRYRNGDMASRDKIICHNIKLVRTIVSRKFYMVDMEEIDLSMIGIIGLIKAVDAFAYFDNSITINFSAYASRSIINEINTYLKKEIKYINRVINNTSMTSLNEENDIERIYFVNDDFVSKYEEEEIRLKVRQMVDYLPDKSREIVKLSYGFYDDKIYQQEEIARILGLTRGNVSMILHRTLVLIEQKLFQIGVFGYSYSKKRSKKMTR